MHACAKLVIAFRDYIGDWLRAPSHLVVPFLPDLICRRRHRVADPLGFCPAHAESLRGYLGGDLPDARDARERYKSAMHRLWIWVGTVRPRVRRVVGNDAQAELQRRQGAHGSVSRQARRPRKISVWDTSGLVLIWKQLQQGAFRWPPVMDGTMKLSAVEFAALFDGLDWTRVQTTKGILKPSVAA